MIRHGVRSTKRDAKSLAFLLTLITPGSGYMDRFKEAGITGLLGTGFDPGVTSVFAAYAQKHYFDEIHTIDILDCNGGDHGYPFATNFNPEINLREVSAPGSYWENGHWWKFRQCRSNGNITSMR